MFDQSVAISAARPAVPLFFEGNYGELPVISYSENDSVLATSGLWFFLVSRQNFLDG